MLSENWQRAHAPSAKPALVQTPLPRQEAALAVRSSQPSARIAIETDMYRAELDRLGGSLSHLELIQEQRSNQDPAVVLFNLDQKPYYLARTGLISTGQVELPNHTTLFTALQPSYRLAPNQQTLAVKLTARRNGVTLEKIWSFNRGSYVIDVEHRIVNHRSEPIEPQLYLELLRDSTPGPSPRFSYTYTGPALYNNNRHFLKVPFKDIDQGKLANEPLADNGWVGMVQHYFASAWLLPEGQNRAVYTGKVGTDLYRIGLRNPAPQIAPGQTLTLHARLFAGPQRESLLETLAPGLELVKDYGWATLIAKPLFWLLDHLHDLSQNWGWSIVLLTLLIKALFFPLSATSYRSMAKMKILMPQVQALREQLKNNPKKMNMALVELYRKEKVNPFGGCLPVLIQIPVFLALYWVLLSSVEMRGAAWIGWIFDLSQPDPYFILPVLMTVSMLAQTKMNPTPPDPTQAKLMMIMPLVFSAMFFFLPAGLVLYYVVNNLLTISQQLYMHRNLQRH